MAFAFYAVAIVILAFLLCLNAPWYFIIGVAILCAGWSIADAIRDGSNKISESIDKSIRDGIQKLKNSIRELKDK